MSRIFISTIIFSTSVLCLCCSSKGAENQKSHSEPESKMMMQVVDSPQNASAKSNLAMDPNSKVDPNAATTKKDGELEKDLRRLERLSKNEAQEWTENNGDNKLDLAKAVNKQVENELKFLRKIAREEGCGKTAGAINRLLLMRKERFTQYSKVKETADTRRRRRTERSEQVEGIEPVRGSRGRDSDLDGMSREERRRAWEERRKAERDRRIQERNERRKSQQTTEYPMTNP